MQASFWNDRYKKEEYIYGKSANEFFAHSLKNIDTKGKLLLPAEGEGRNAVFAASLGWEVDAFDYSEEGRKKALSLASEQQLHINYEVRNLTEWKPYPEIYDAVGLVYMHLKPELRQQVHQNLVYTLKPKGIIILEAFRKEQLELQSGGPKNKDMLYNKAELAEDFKGLNIDLLEEQDVELEEGAYHKGFARVIRLIARKGSFQ